MIIRAKKFGRKTNVRILLNTIKNLITTNDQVI